MDAEVYVGVVDDKGRSSPTGGGRQVVSTGLDSATCVSPDGRRLAATGFVPVVLGLGGLAGAAIVGLLAVARGR